MTAVTETRQDEGRQLERLQAELDAARGLVARQQKLLLDLAAIGKALSSEKDHGRLLEMIVNEAKKYTPADGCTLYVRAAGEDALHFRIIQNNSLGIALGSGEEQISWPPVPLYLADGIENHRNASAHCALTGEIVKISDVYDTEFDFHGTKEFDATTGYRSKSMLILPLRDHQDEIIGVIQLLNSIHPNTGEIVDFAEHEVAIVASLASQAAIAVTNRQLINDLEELLEAIVLMVATAIDEKSAYTGGHVQRVMEITEELACQVNSCQEGILAGVTLTADQIRELRMASWLHDVGKIVTPEHIIDKATKLETPYDRIEVIRYRLELLRQEKEIQRLQNRLAILEGGTEETGAEGQEGKDADDILAFLSKVNQGGEFLRDENIARLEEIATQVIHTSRGTEPLLTRNEVENLSIRRGTLTEDERQIINNHIAVTIKMLETLPFPRKLRNVPLYAGQHHEKLNGSGYPKGLSEGEIPLQSKILAVSDVFEALTAADRPYKQGKLLSESMRIMEFMVKDGHLDSASCDLLARSGVAVRYAKKNLAPRQQTAFEWKGETFGMATDKGNPAGG